MSAANYVYILSGQKILKNAKNAQLEACGQTVLPDMSILIGQKLAKKVKMEDSNETFWVIFKQCELPSLK